LTQAGGVEYSERAAIGKIATVATVRDRHVTETSKPESMSNPHSPSASPAPPPSQWLPDQPSAELPATDQPAMELPAMELSVTQLAAPPGSDEQLLTAFRDSGDRQAFETLVRRYEKELFHYLKAFLRDHQAAEDIFQLTFLTVYRSSHQFQPGRRFRPWLYAIATNRAIDLQRSRKNRRAISLEASQTAAPGRGGSDAGHATFEIADPQPTVEQLVSAREDQARLQQAIDDLPDATRQLLQLAYVRQLKYSEISEILDIPVGTVKSRVFYAIRRLRDIWHKRFPS
jgi:RNA polymerase sigma-70 factor, ECF subfamily